jgi:hypothetical protein
MWSPPFFFNDCAVLHSQPASVHSTKICNPYNSPLLWSVLCTAMLE